MRSLDQLQRAAAETGFPADGLEKVLNLLRLLDGFRAHPYLKTRLALKGGTALNLFEFDVPRLSVDIDLNYVGSPDRDTMLAERPEVERAIVAVCGRLDLTVKRVPSEHAGGKWRLGYQRAAGGTGTLEIGPQLHPPRTAMARGPARVAHARWRVGGIRARARPP
jgi:predicted nucleotidyltransferase component of viral defense system